MNEAIDNPSGEKRTASVLDRPDTVSESFKSPQMGVWRRRLTLVSLCLTLFLGALDTTIIATALPNISNQLRVTSAEYPWIGSGYNLATTTSTPIWVKLSDVFGRKSTIMTAASIFMVGSLVSAQAQSSVSLLAGRVVQGLGGGGSMVLVSVIIGDLFPLSERPKYYALIGSAFGVASGLGPVLGGVFTDGIGWRWCFYINLPFGGIAILLLYLNLDLSTEREAIAHGLAKLDWIGFLLIIGGTICFLYGLEAGSSGLSDWSSATVICMLVFGIIILALFLAWEAKFAKGPLIPVRIFQQRTCLASFVVSCIHAFVFTSFDFFLPLYYQVVLGFSPLISGLIMLAMVIPMSFTTLSGGFVIRRTGDYLTMIIGGTVILTVGTGLFISFGTHVAWPKIVVFEIVAGIGAGLLFQRPMISLQSYLKPEDTAAGISAFTFLRNMFTSMSTVIGTVLMQQKIGSGSLTVAIPDAAHRKQYVMGLRDMWIFYTSVASMSILASFFIQSDGLKRTDKKQPVLDNEPTVS
ncbi:Efflux pump dotC [Penicillium herquei]|nr:Efflux pump dotC [Penicillium herquei]